MSSHFGKKTCLTKINRFIRCCISLYAICEVFQPLGKRHLATELQKAFKNLCNTRINIDFTKSRHVEDEPPFLFLHIGKLEQSSSLPSLRTVQELITLRSTDVRS